MGDASTRTFIPMLATKTSAYPMLDAAEQAPKGLRVLVGYGHVRLSAFQAGSDAVLVSEASGFGFFWFCSC